jgi:hypothetical protein
MYHFLRVGYWRKTAVRCIYAQFLAFSYEIAPNRGKAPILSDPETQNRHFFITFRAYPYSF